MFGEDLNKRFFCKGCGQEIYEEGTKCLCVGCFCESIGMDLDEEPRQSNSFKNLIADIDNAINELQR